MVSIYWPKSRKSCSPFCLLFKILDIKILQVSCDKNSSKGASFFDFIWEVRPVGTSSFNGKLQLALTPKIHWRNVADFVDNHENRRGSWSRKWALIIISLGSREGWSSSTFSSRGTMGQKFESGHGRMFFSLFKFILALCAQERLATLWFEKRVNLCSNPRFLKKKLKFQLTYGSSNWVSLIAIDFTQSTWFTTSKVNCKNISEFLSKKFPIDFQSPIDFSQLHMIRPYSGIVFLDDRPFFKKK